MDNFDLLKASFDESFAELEKQFPNKKSKVKRNFVIEIARLVSEMCEMEFSGKMPFGIKQIVNYIFHIHFFNTQNDDDITRTKKQKSQEYKQALAKETMYALKEYCKSYAWLPHASEFSPEIYSIRFVYDRLIDILRGVKDVKVHFENQEQEGHYMLLKSIGFDMIEIFSNALRLATETYPSGVFVLLRALMEAECKFLVLLDADPKVERIYRDFAIFSALDDDFSSEAEKAKIEEYAKRFNQKPTQMFRNFGWLCAIDKNAKMTIKHLMKLANREARYKEYKIFTQFSHANSFIYSRQGNECLDVLMLHELMSSAIFLSGEISEFLLKYDLICDDSKTKELKASVDKMIEIYGKIGERK